MLKIKELSRSEEIALEEALSPLIRRFVAIEKFIITRGRKHESRIGNSIWQVYTAYAPWGLNSKDRELMRAKRKLEKVYGKENVNEFFRVLVEEKEMKHRLLRAGTSDLEKTLNIRLLRW